jgi:selenium-binding protein 1
MNMQPTLISRVGTVFLVAAFTIMASAVKADETCMSPYMAKITGQEDYVYVWTLGAEGVGDEQDKLVTIDVRPASDTFGKVVSTLSVGGRNEAHHSGLSDDRRYLWAGGLDSNHIFVFDIHSDPMNPTLHRTIKDFEKKTGGLVGPHTFYALQGRVMVSALSNNRDHGGRTGLAEYTNDGRYITSHWMPTDGDLRGAVKSGKFADGYGYDVRALPRRNMMLTSSFTGWSNYMMDFGKMVQDPEAMKRFGNTMVVWDLHQRQPKKVLDVPGAPLEIRCAWDPRRNYCFTTTALTSELWVVYEENGEWKAKKSADIGRNPGDPKIPLPVDISITADDQGLWIQTWMDGKTRYFDISDPFNGKQVFEEQIGNQVNMISQSWDGKRLYFSSSLLGNWDRKQGEGDLQYVKLYHWDVDKQEMKLAFNIDFLKENLGYPHQMRFGAYSLYGSAPASDELKVTQATR